MGNGSCISRTSTARWPAGRAARRACRSPTASEIGLSLFDLENDVGETTNVADQHPEVVARLKRFAEEARLDLGDGLARRSGNGIREAGRLGPDDARLEWQ